MPLSDSLGFRKLGPLVKLKKDFVWGLGVCVKMPGWSSKVDWGKKPWKPEIGLVGSGFAGLQVDGGCF